MGSSEYPDQLLIALEPEAASIYVRRLRMHQLIPEHPERRPLSPRKEQVPPEGANLDRVADEFGNGKNWVELRVLLKQSKQHSFRELLVFHTSFQFSMEL